MDTPQWKTYAPNWRTILSAALVVFAFPPWDLSFLIWFALVPWYAALYRSPTIKEAAIQGVWMGFFMELGGFPWVAYAIHAYGNLPWPVSILGLIIFCFFGQLQFIPYAAIWRWLRPGEYGLAASFAIRVIVQGLVFAFLYTGIDWITPKLFADQLGHVFYQAKYLRQIADIGGVPILSFGIVLINESLWAFFRYWSHRRTMEFPSKNGVVAQLALACLFWLGILIYGHVRFPQIQKLQGNPDRTVRMAVIQANIGDFDKVAAEQGVGRAAFNVMTQYYAVTEQALKLSPVPQTAIWPETAYPSTFRTPQFPEEYLRDQTLDRFVVEKKLALLFGGYDRIRTRSGSEEFNAFFFLNANDTSLQVYRKHNLLLFGEYIPGSKSYLPFLHDWFPTVGNFGRGDGPKAFPLNFANGSNIVVAPNICYEVLFSDYVLEAVRKGAQAIVNITNDSWFGSWIEPHQHLALATFRTVETRRPLLRATNTGISALVVPDGTIAEKTEIGVQEILNAEVPVIPAIDTLLLKWGNWFAWTSLFLGVFGIFCYWRLRRH